MQVVVVAITPSPSPARRTVVARRPLVSIYRYGDRAISPRVSRSPPAVYNIIFPRRRRAAACTLCGGRRRYYPHTRRRRRRDVVGSYTVGRRRTCTIASRDSRTARVAARVASAGHDVSGKTANDCIRCGNITPVGVVRLRRTVSAVGAFRATSVTVLFVLSVHSTVGVVRRHHVGNII